MDVIFYEYMHLILLCGVKYLKKISFEIFRLFGAFWGARMTRNVEMYQFLSHPSSQKRFKKSNNFKTDFFKVFYATQKY